MSDNVDILCGDLIITIEILKLGHTWECLLTLGQFIGIAACVTRCGVVGDARLQRPYAIHHVEVVDRIDACTLQTLDQTDGLIDLHKVVVVRYTHGRAPIGVGTGGYTFHQLIDIVLVVVDGSTEAQVEILGTDNFIIQGEFDTLVGGLTDILVLITETSGGIARHTHQDILGGVPVEVEGTTQLTIPETEVETDIT